MNKSVRPKEKLHVTPSEVSKINIDANINEQFKNL